MRLQGCNRKANNKRRFSRADIVCPAENGSSQKILTFSNKISKQLSKPDRKFTADITYGMLASQSCLLTDVVDQLHEDSKKINIVDRLSRHLDKGTPGKAAVIDEIDDTHISKIPIPLLRNHDVQEKINTLALEANKKRYEAYKLE